MVKSSETAVNAFDALMDAAVDAIIIINAEGRIQRFNQAAVRLFEYNEDEVKGRNVNMLMPEPHRSLHDGYLSHYRNTGQASIIGQGREESGRKKSGETFPMLLSVGEIRQAGVRRFVGIIRDLSAFRAAQEQVRQLEEQLLHADRLVILGELTAGIAHEINQPLTAIAAYADAGKSMISRPQPASGEDLQKICERIAQQSRRAAEVVQRLRKLVRSGSVTKSSHDINQIIRNILLLFEYEVKKLGIELVFKPMDSLEPLYVDEVQIQQILVNLVKNSLDAIAESRKQDGRIEIAVSRDGTDALVSVRDNGPGVADDVRARLFDSFFTTKPKGVGLGLSICKSIAAAHGGRLGYTGSQDGGSVFILSLPLESIG